MSHVYVSFDEPEYTANADGMGTLRILEADCLLGLTEKINIPGVYVRIVWISSSDPTILNNAFLSSFSLCC